ncbi:hypothetical protein, partial [Massilia sp. S19_KUP03_FR1]|uniref:hypothetical protein n=1 Tax=Massilia sp. S19_KUP03_FR1 TaxID=3025503 RepID=UPI002FCD9D41
QKQSPYISSQPVDLLQQFAGRRTIAKPNRDCKEKEPVFVPPELQCELLNRSSFSAVDYKTINLLIGKSSGQQSYAALHFAIRREDERPPAIRRPVPMTPDKLM